MEEVDHTKIPLASQKYDLQFIFKRFRAVALILAFIVISKALRPKIEEIRLLPLPQLKRFFQEKWPYFLNLTPLSPTFINQGHFERQIFG